MDAQDPASPVFFSRPLTLDNFQVVFEPVDQSLGERFLKNNEASQGRFGARAELQTPQGPAQVLVGVDINITLLKTQIVVGVTVPPDQKGDYEAEMAVVRQRPNRVLQTFARLPDSQAKWLGYLLNFHAEIEGARSGASALGAIATLRENGLETRIPPTHFQYQIGWEANDHLYEGLTLGPFETKSFSPRPGQQIDVSKIESIGAGILVTVDCNTKPRTTAGEIGKTAMQVFNHLSPRVQSIIDVGVSGLAFTGDNL